MQADVEISFEVNKNDIGEAEVLEKWTDPQILCSQKGTSVKSGLGPFGLLVFASKGLQEFTSVFFRIFKFQNKNLVLFCSDQSRFFHYPLIIFILRVMLYSILSFKFQLYLIKMHFFV